MALAKVSDEWIPLQITVFTRWVNEQLKEVNDAEIQDITKDFSSGVHLINLARVLTHKEPQIAWKPDPKLQFHEVENCNLAVEMFKNDGVNLLNISGRDVNENNVKLILGMVWMLILHYSIGKSIGGDDSKDQDSDGQNKKSSKNALMDWAIERTSNYPNVNNNFTPYDLSICALLDSYVPDKINYSTLTKDDTEHNAQVATDVMNDLGIPVYIYPDDIIKGGNVVDDKTLLTQLASAKVVLDNLHKREIQEREIKLEDEKLEKENQLEKEELDNLKSEFSKANSALSDSIRCLKYEVHKLKRQSAQLLSLQEKMTSTNESDEHEQIRKEIQNLQTELQALNSKTTESNNESAEKSEVKSEIENLKTELSEVRSQLEKSQNENNSFKETIDTLKSEIEKLKESSDQAPVVQERSISLNEPNENEQLKQEIEKLQSEVQKLTTQIQENDSNDDKCKEEVEKLAKEKEECKTEIESLRNELSEVRSQVEKLNESPGQLPEVKERSINLNGSDEHEQLRKDLQSVQSELQKMNSQAQSDSNKTYLFILIILIALLVCIKLLN